MAPGWRRLLTVVLALSLSSRALSDGSIVHDAARRLVMLADAERGLVLRLNYDGRCVLDRVEVLGRQVVAPETGVCSAVKAGDTWFTTRVLAAAPTAAIDGNTLSVASIVFGPDDMKVSEDWRFTVEDNRILWRIERTYHGAGALEDTYFPGWDFRAIDTWTGGLLDTGGVVWTRYLDTPLATYGAHSGAVTFWNRERGDCLRIVPAVADGRHVASRFSRHPSGVFSANFSASDEELRLRHGLVRFLADRQDLWQPFSARPGDLGVLYSLQALRYDEACDRGTIEGLPGGVIRELLNTIGRYGVVDRGIVGSNGWRSGFAVMHEPWIAQMGLAVNDPEYTAGVAGWLDDVARRAIRPDGRVLSRWHHGPGDAMPGTYDATSGYYECQWGYTMDSQPSYVINVAETFDLNGDQEWLKKHRDTCRAALDFLLRRDADGDGLVEMMNESHTEGTCSDWIDIVWAAHENALVNAEMFEALNLWAPLEALLGDLGRAALYRDAAERLRASFNRPIGEGGFWNPEKKWYVYWRDKDGSVHGDNLVVPVNFGAIAYGVCDDEGRRDAVLDRIEALMQNEGLFHWPLCFFPYAPEEVHASQRQFPTYENGDIFLGWGEIGVRAYARRDPAIAVKYIRRVLERYEKDGLSFQRYTRATQTGVGDDILANNANTIVGLYRDIYGVRPRHDRLWIEPHLTPELAGTRLKYTLRGRQYLIALEGEHVSVGCDGWTIRGRAPLGVRISRDSAEYFTSRKNGEVLRIGRSSRVATEVGIEAWERHGARAWTLSTGATRATVRHTIGDLQSGAAVQVLLDGTVLSTRAADSDGRIEFSVSTPAGGSRRVEVVPR